MKQTCKNTCNSTHLSDYSYCHKHDANMLINNLCSRLKWQNSVHPY